MNWSVKVIRRGTVKICLLDQLHNMYFVLKLWMLVYLVDYIIGRSDIPEAEARFKLMLYGWILLIPFAVEFFIMGKYFNKWDACSAHARGL